jgi:hypothetical protein
MNLEQYATPATIEAIYKYYKDKRKNEHRPHLGGSQIGNDCSRALWYQFRHAWRPKFDGRMLRLFETGDREEDRVVSNLRAVGVTVWERDPETGKQVRFTECGGHFALSLDGVGLGFAESKKPHTLEFKTMSEKNFKAMKNLGCQKSKPVYWAQCQIGMYLAEIDRCYFFCVNKNTDEIFGERIKLDKREAKGLVEKANKIVFADTPPSRLSEDASFWQCKWCTHWAVCHGCKIPEVSCRTCSHVTPEQDGTWSCAKGKPVETCSEHLFIPQIMPKDFVVTDAGDTFVEYEDQDSGEIIRNENNSQAIFDERMRHG